MSLEFTPVTVEHADVIHSAITGNVTNYFYSFKNISETKLWIKEAVLQHQLGNKEEYVVFDGDEFIGMISPNFISPTEAGVGLWISEKHQGKGYGKAALKKLISALAGKGIEKLYYETDKENVESIRLANSLNFVLENDSAELRFFKDLKI